jgi:hypothetical protein
MLEPAEERATVRDAESGGYGGSYEQSASFPDRDGVGNYTSR